MEIFRPVFLCLIFFQGQTFVRFGQFIPDGRTFMFQFFHVGHFSGGQFIHVTDGLVCIVFRILENFTGLLVGFTENPFFLPGQIILFGFQFFF